MSSKIGNDGLIRRLARSLTPRSIALRLGIWQAACGFGLLVIGTGFLYWPWVSDLRRDDDEYLMERAAVLRSELSGERVAAGEIAEEIARESGQRQPARLYVRILDWQGRVLGETAGMSARLPSALFSSGESVGGDNMHVFGLRSIDGSQFRAATFAIGAPSKADRKLVELALDFSSDQALVDAFRTRLMLILALGLVLFGVTAYFIARRSLRPIAELNAIVGQITALRLKERIAAQHWPAELTELASRFDSMLDRLDESFERLSQFSADIAHELRTPLNVLRGEAEVALSKARSPEQYREVIESSLEEYERLSRLVDSLLFLARTEHRSEHIERRGLNARSEVLAVCDFYEAVAADKQIAIQVSGDAQLIADPLLFRRALGNLLSNALRHVPEQGRIDIAISQRDDRVVRVAVKDTGPGIPPEHLPRVFDRFYRADPARARSQEGSGLGLPIVKSIMTLHGGQIELHNEPGVEFEISLLFPPAGTVA